MVYSLCDSKIRWDEVCLSILCIKKLLTSVNKVYHISVYSIIYSLLSNNNETLSQIISVFKFII